jgi:hypothetical protein
MRRFHRLTPPSAVVRPIIDGKRTTYYEWADAGEVHLQAGGTAMAHGAQILRRLGYGFDEQAIYLRIDFGIDLFKLAGGDREMDVMVTAPVPMLIRVPLHQPDPAQFHATLLTPEADDDAVRPASPSIAAHAMIECHGGHSHEGPALSEPVRAASGEVLELAIPRGLVKLVTGGTLEFFLSVASEHEEVVRYPAREIFQLEVPSWDRISELWAH